MTIEPLVLPPSPSRQSVVECDGLTFDVRIAVPDEAPDLSWAGYDIASGCCRAVEDEGENVHGAWVGPEWLLCVAGHRTVSVRVGGNPLHRTHDETIEAMRRVALEALARP